MYDLLVYLPQPRDSVSFCSESYSNKIVLRTKRLIMTMPTSKYFQWILNPYLGEILAVNVPVPLSWWYVMLGNRNMSRIGCKAINTVHVGVGVGMTVWTHCLTFVHICAQSFQLTWIYHYYKGGSAINPLCFKDFISPVHCPRQVCKFNIFAFRKKPIIHIVFFFDNSREILVIY